MRSVPFVLTLIAKDSLPFNPVRHDVGSMRRAPMKDGGTPTMLSHVVGKLGTIRCWSQGWVGFAPALAGVCFRDARMSVDASLDGSLGMRRGEE